MTNLEYDIKFYNGLIKKTQDPTIKQMLERKLTAKIEKKFTMSANVFTVTTFLTILDVSNIINNLINLT
jgi:hypothetical protein